MAFALRASRSATVRVEAKKSKAGTKAGTKVHFGRKALGPECLWLAICDKKEIACLGDMWSLQARGCDSYHSGAALRCRKRQDQLFAQMMPVACDDFTQGPWPCYRAGVVTALCTPWDALFHDKRALPAATATACPPPIAA
jgi:hypothetical protein